MGMNLGNWRQEYLRAARANDVLGMHSLIKHLYQHVRGHELPADVEQNAGAKGWEGLCAQAQHEQNPDRLLNLITQINVLLEEEQNKKQRRQ
jgi:hypothetical protein